MLSRRGIELSITQELNDKARISVRMFLTKNDAKNLINSLNEILENEDE